MSKRKFKTITDLKKKAESYFKYINKGTDVPSITGLCRHLKIYTSQLVQIENYKDTAFKEYIQEVRERIADEYLYMMMFKKTRSGVKINTTGSLFWLKCHGYNEQQAQQDHSITINVQLSLPEPRQDFIEVNTIKKKLIE